MKKVLKILRISEVLIDFAQRRSVE